MGLAWDKRLRKPVYINMNYIHKMFINTDLREIRGLQRNRIAAD